MYFFLEENTPAGYTIKIMPSSWQFLVFDKQGNSVDIYGNSKKFTNNLPLLMFVGEKFKIKRDYLKEYYLLKVRNGNMIVPYIDRTNEKSCYTFVEMKVNIDVIPVRIICVPNISVMMKTIDAKITPDFTLVDDTLSASDIFIIQNRYRAETIINVDEKTEDVPDVEDTDEYIFDNLNMYSQNPVFLAAAHLRAMDISKLNQLLFDFQLTPVDLEGIIYYLNTYIKKHKAIGRNTSVVTMFTRLKKRMDFHLLLLLNDTGPDIISMIETEEDLNMLHSFKDLIVKVRLFTSGEQNKDILNNYEALLDKRYIELGETGQGLAAII